MGMTPQLTPTPSTTKQHVARTPIVNRNITDHNQLSTQNTFNAATEQQNSFKKAYRRARSTNILYFNVIRCIRRELISQLRKLFYK